MSTVKPPRPRRALRPLAATLALILSYLFAVGLLAQEAVDEEVVGGGASEIRGVVVDGITGEAIPEVTIILDLNVPGSRPFVRTTDAEGRFVIVGPPPGLYDAAFMRMGYRAIGDTFRLDDAGEIELVAEMLPEAVALDPVVVTAESMGREVFRTQMDGFFERMRTFPGDFFTRSDIDRIDPDDITQLLLQVGPFRSVRGAPGERNQVVGRGGCAPSYYLDGAALAMSPVDMLDPDHLEAMEVYRGSFVPAEFQVGPAASGGDFGLTPGSCGTVVLWSQDGERSRRASTAAPTVRSEGDWPWFPMVMVVAATAGTYLVGR